MNRWMCAFVIVLGIGAGVGFAQTGIVTYFGPYQDTVLAEAPCAHLEAPQPLSHERRLFLFYACNDGRTIAREFAAQIELPAPAPVSLTACPASGHRACSCLPSGSYRSDWIETVGCSR